MHVATSPADPGTLKQVTRLTVRWSAMVGGNGNTQTRLSMSYNEHSYAELSGFVK